MKKGEVIIDEEQCQGCGFCTKFCSRGCLVISGDRFTPQGYLLPTFIEVDKCTACGVCAILCPAEAIEVYKYSVKAPSQVKISI